MARAHARKSNLQPKAAAFFGSRKPKPSHHQQTPGNQTFLEQVNALIMCQKNTRYL